MRFVLFDFGGLVLIVFRLGWLLWVILLCWLVCGLWGWCLRGCGFVLLCWVFFVKD